MTDGETEADKQQVPSLPKTYIPITHVPAQEQRQLLALEAL
jgi:hypothetical protein